MTKRRAAAIVGALVLVCALLAVVATWSRPTLEQMSHPDVDALLFQYRHAWTVAEQPRLRKQILDLGYPATQRLITIMRDPNRDPVDRSLAISLLSANPDALFAMADLLDDPDTPVRVAARMSVQGCLPREIMSADPKSDTAVRRIMEWRKAHQEEGYGALKFRGATDSQSITIPAELPRDPEKLFDLWSRDGVFDNHSPCCAALKKIGAPATRTLLRIALSDTSPLRRAMACGALGLIGDTSALSPLEEAMKKTSDHNYHRALECAVILLTRQLQP